MPIANLGINSCNFIVFLSVHLIMFVVSNMEHGHFTCFVSMGKMVKTSGYSSCMENIFRWFTRTSNRSRHHGSVQELGFYHRGTCEYL